MGFFSLLETFFFISLAITFVLIIMLVYHFKGRLVSIEDRYHTMFEIVNSLVKEMKNLRDTMAHTQAITQDARAQAQQSQQGQQGQQSPFGGNSGGFPEGLFRLLQSGPGMFQSSMIQEEDDEDYEEEEDNEEEQEYKKIVVSDTELDSEDEEEGEDENVKIISLPTESIEPADSVSLDELEESIDIDIRQYEGEDEIDIDITLDEGEANIDIDITPDEDEEPAVEVSTTESIDYRKLDVTYLRTMVLTRGLATDTKKMKKTELIRLLEEAN